MGQNLSQSCCADDKQGQANQIDFHIPAISGFDHQTQFDDIGDSQLQTIQQTRHWKGKAKEKNGVQSLPDVQWEDAANGNVMHGNTEARVGEAKSPVSHLAPPVVNKNVEGSIEKSHQSISTTKTEGDYPGYVDLNSCRLGDAIDSIISIPIIILQIIWITMEDQESTEGSIYYWTAAGMEIYLLIELWGYVLIGEVTPMSLLSLWLIRKLRHRYKFTFMPFPDVIRRISRFMLGLSLIANTALSFWPGVNDLIPLALSIQLWLALMASAGMNQ